MARGKFFGWLATIVVWCVAPAWADEPPTPAACGTVAARTLRQITADVQQNLRAEAVAKAASQRDAAVRQLIRLHSEVAEHEMFATSDTLQRTLRRLRERLRKVAKELRDTNGDHPRDSQRARKTRARTVHVKPRNTVLAQQPPLNRPAAQGGVGAPIIGQPVPGDNGPALVDLIERTISPPIWDVNGGPSSILYFAPRHALVVRAPGQTHRDVARMVNGLRRAGR